MDDPLQMSVLDGLADRHEQLQPLPRVQLLFVAELGDRNAFDQFHHEVGPAGVRRSSVENLGDVGMRHHRQRLPLRFEAGDDFLRVHPRLDDLQRDLAADGFLLLGDVDDSHPSFAQLLADFVGADLRAGAFDRRRARDRTASVANRLQVIRGTGYSFRTLATGPLHGRAGPRRPRILARRYSRRASSEWISRAALKIDLSSSLLAGMIPCSSSDDTSRRALPSRAS